MIIGNVTPSYYPNLGGIENYIRRLKFSLEEEGHKVNVYTTDWRIKTQPHEKNIFYFKTDLVVLRNPISIEMLHNIRKTKDDIYHFHAPWFLTNVMSNIVIRNKPKILTLHGIQLHGPIGVFLTNTFYYPFAKTLMNSSNFIIAQAENEVQVLIKHFKIDRKKIKVIPNGIEIDKFKHPGKTLCRNFIKKYNLKEDSIKILFISRLVPHKNPDKLIEAIRLIENENLEVIIIGEESNFRYSDYLRKIAKEDKRIHILGKVDFKEIIAAYYSSDIFTFLSIWDAMAAVVLEAMLCGLPILTTRTGCIPFVVEDYVNGVYVKSLKPKEIASKIKELIDLGENELKNIGRKNTIKIKKNYNWKYKVKEINKVYEELYRC